MSVKAFDSVIAIPAEDVDPAALKGTAAVLETSLIQARERTPSVQLELVLLAGAEDLVLIPSTGVEARVKGRQGKTASSMVHRRTKLGLSVMANEVAQGGRIAPSSDEARIGQLGYCEELPEGNGCLDHAELLIADICDHHLVRSLLRLHEVSRVACVPYSEW